MFDQFLAFIALEAGLFSLGLPDAYLQLNDPGAKDTQIEVPSLPELKTVKKERKMLSPVRGASRWFLHECMANLFCEDGVGTRRHWCSMRDSCRLHVVSGCKSFAQHSEVLVGHQEK